jgi:hypothetical protein
MNSLVSFWIIYELFKDITYYIYMSITSLFEKRLFDVFLSKGNFLLDVVFIAKFSLSKFICLYLLHP